ncbi:MAG: hypothetical protein MJ218_01355 [Opitutales bacterium]|nr:hypothetical protein [Opitutales bacterium]
MRKSYLAFLALSASLGMSLPAYGYVMVRSGFGELKADEVSSFNKQQGAAPDWVSVASGNGNEDPAQLVFGDAISFVRDANCTKGRFDYKGHHNLSVALGRRFNVFDLGALGIEIEILGAYARYDKKDRDQAVYDLPVGGGLIEDEMEHQVNMPRPDFLFVQYAGKEHRAQIRPMYLKNQRIVGAQANFYWEQYLLDWLSAGIGGGIGGAYVCTKFSTLEFDTMLGYLRDAGDNDYHFLWFSNGAKFKQGRKYAHSGALLYNFMLFVRAEKFETLFEVGYRHIGLHQIFDNKMWGQTINKLANMHSDQIYLGLGRTF